MNEKEIAFILLCIDHLGLNESFYDMMLANSSVDWKDILEKFLLQHPEVIKLKEDHDSIE